MRTRSRSVVSVSLMAVWLGWSGLGFSQDEWTKKPFRQWSKEEAQRVLNDSPWAQTQEARIDFGREVRRIAGAPRIGGAPVTGELGGANVPIDYRITLRLRSGLPIRQALVRLKELEARYDRMSEKDRGDFDSKTKGLLDCPACAQNYVVTISCKSTNYPGADALFDGLRGATLPAIKPYVRILNDRGVQRELIHFVAPKAPGEETIFFFPRFDDEGGLLITPSHKKLLFRLSDSNAKALTNFEFDVSRLVLNGEVTF